MKSTKIVFNILLIIASFFLWQCNSDNDIDITDTEPIIQITKETSSAGFSARGNHTSLVFNDKIWVIGGRDLGPPIFKNDVWSSSDGINWTEETPSAGFLGRFSHSSVVFNNKLWVIGGYGENNQDLNDVWSSSDGINWTEETASAGFSTRVGHSSVVFNDKLWIIGGRNQDLVINKNDVWSSSDGINWIEETASAGFSARVDHSSVVFNNKLWIISGTDIVNKRDAWSSSDGINWTEEASLVDFLNVGNHTSLVFNNKIWNIAGRTGYSEESTNNIIYSSDGVNWMNFNINGMTTFSPRSSHSSVIFNNKLWIIGGVETIRISYYEIDYSFKNDIWSLSLD